MADVVRFPDGFLWGAATAAHQVEGGNRWSDWWEYEQRGKVPHRSGEACRHYELYPHDFDLCRSLGHNAHRFSIEWSRIEPAEGEWNAEALAHYRDVILALKGRGLEPIVTLHHFTNPAWFLRRGGWSRGDSPKLFARYVARVANEIGSTVTYWITVNEPTVYVLQGYVLGSWPPCERNDWLTAVRVFRNLARAHVSAYRLLHRQWPGLKVGFAHSAPLIRPCNPSRLRDRAAAALRDAALNRAFFWLVGRTLDFVALNYYTRNFVRSDGWGLGALVGRLCHTRHHDDDGPVSVLGWEVFPEGLAMTLERYSAYGLPLLITENGIATDDDALRREFIVRHLNALAVSVQRGINVKAYLYWSLIDNFEWAAGTTARFGLAETNYTTQQRTVRQSAEAFARACRANEFEVGGPDAERTT
jgi:beta-glucosidase